MNSAPMAGGSMRASAGPLSQRSAQGEPSPVAPGPCVVSGVSVTSALFSYIGFGQRTSPMSVAQMVPVWSTAWLTYPWRPFRLAPSPYLLYLSAHARWCAGQTPPGDRGLRFWERLWGVQNSGGRLGFAPDGSNDAPSLPPTSDDRPRPRLNQERRSRCINFMNIHQMPW